jgi:hypothetical protein
MDNTMALTLAQTWAFQTEPNAKLSKLRWAKQKAIAQGYLDLRTQLAERDAQLAAAMEALGAHIQADAYRSSFPDNDADAEYLRKQETWWRLMARQWLLPQISEDAAHAAKIKVANSPAFQREIHAITAKWRTK